MCAHVVLLVEPVASHQSRPAIAKELENAGYEVVETHNLNVAAAMVFIDRRIEAVVLDVVSESFCPELARGMSAIRPAVPLFSVSMPEIRTAAENQDWSVVISALNNLFHQPAA